MAGELYKDKEWLKNKYLNKKFSGYQIAKLSGVSNVTIYNYLKKFNIICRSNSESNHLCRANHCNLSKKAIEWINGELLGDGCISKRRRFSAKIQYGSKYLEYIKYISNTLKSFGIKQVGKHIYIEKTNGKKCYHYHSKEYTELSKIYKQWYPNGKKIIPKDLKLTPLTFRQLHIGD